LSATLSGSLPLLPRTRRSPLLPYTTLFRSPRVEALVNEIIGRVADKWTMIVIDVLAEHGELRFTGIARRVPGISQRMLTRTLRQMEREGLVQRTVHPVVPPRVEYRLTDLGLGLGDAFCGVWIWAERNLEKLEQARAEFDARGRGG